MFSKVFDSDKYIACRFIVFLLCLLCISQGLSFAESEKASDDPVEGTEVVTVEQVKGWLLACSGVLWQNNHDDFETLPGRPINEQDLKNRVEAQSGEAEELPVTTND